LTTVRRKAHSYFLISTVCYTGYDLNTFVDMLRFIEEHLLPDALEDIEDDAQYYTIPMDYGKNAIGVAGRPQVHAICMTAKRQILWIQQLLGSEMKFVLHVDGKHKLHNGKWILMTIGPHVLRHHKVKKQVILTICYDICMIYE